MIETSGADADGEILTEEPTVKATIYPPLSHVSEGGKSTLVEGSREIDGKRRPTRLRKSYEAEAEGIKRKLGDLETIRGKLGLSQRKMCQLLLVDPSAWTRWTQKKSAPPHILRMLEWYLALNDKLPEVHTRYYQTPQFMQKMKTQYVDTDATYKSELENVRQDAFNSQMRALVELEKFKAQMKRERLIFYSLFAILGAISLLKLWFTG